MCTRTCVSVGVSKAPMATPIQSWWSGSQKSDEPQVEQKPRRAFSPANQWTLSEPVIVKQLLGTSVEANQCPENLRHSLQWQTSGPGNEPLTSKRTAPHKHDPWCISEETILPHGETAGLRKWLLGILLVVNATSTIDANLSGVGSITYFGNSKVNKAVTDVGKINPG